MRNNITKLWLLVVLGILWTSPALAVTVTFRQGLNGYSGTQDATAENRTPMVSRGDDDIGAVGNLNGESYPGDDWHTFIRFTNLGIPAGQQIVSATLNIDTKHGGIAGTNPIQHDVYVWGLLKPFNEGSSENGLYINGASTWTHQFWSPLRGDFDFNDAVTNADIQNMLDALGDLANFKLTTGISDAGLLAAGDFSGNGSVGSEDIQGLLDLLVGGPFSANPNRIPWDAPGATGAGDREAEPDDIVTVTGNADYFFDVTASFTKQYNAGVEHGWMLDLPSHPDYGTVGSYVAWGSSEAPLGSNRPTLTVVYQPMAGSGGQSAPEPSTGILLAVGGLGWLLCRTKRGGSTCVAPFVLSAVVIVACSTGANAANVFLSPVGTVGGGASIGNPTVEISQGASSSLYIWVTDELLVNRGFALNVAVTGTSNVIQFNAAQAYNFDLHTTVNGTVQGDSGSNRWQAVSNFSSSSPQVGTELVQNLNAVTAADNGGIRPENVGPGSGPGLLDLGYDASANAFLYGRVDFSGAGSGSTTVALQTSYLGIMAGNTNISNQFTFGSATINVTGQASLAGDFNDNGAVDASDYVVWRKNEGSNNPLPNDNGAPLPVGQGHYNLWKQNFGETGGGGGAAVPEPQSLMMTIVALFIMTGCKWQQRRRWGI